MRQHESNAVHQQLDALRGAGKRALCQFVIAGDPSPDVAERLVKCSLAGGVDVIEYCVPFQRSITDGPVIRQGYQRALAAGMTLERSLATLERLARVCPVVLIADYRETIRPLDLETFAGMAAEAGAGAILPHGLPAVLTGEMDRAAANAGLGMVSTCYPNSTAETKRLAARRGTAFTYLVSSFGKSGGKLNAAALKHPISLLREFGAGPIGVGFGIGTAQDHRNVFAAGADMTISGSAFTQIVTDNIGNDDETCRLWTVALAEIAAAKGNGNSPEQQDCCHGMV